jgi:hypothetical protein
VVGLALGAPLAQAQAQQGPDGGSGPAPAASPDGGADAPPAPGPAAVPPASAGLIPLPQSVQMPQESETFVPLPPPPEGTVVVPERRTKPLKTTVGIPPTTSDLGSETDVAARDTGVTVAERNNWSLNIKGYLRAPMRVGYGPRDDAFPGNEWHSPPRMVGFSSSNWTYIALSPNSSASVRATISNPRVSGTMILTTSVFPTVGYEDLDSSGGVAQGFVNIKFPDAFGNVGGLVLTVGSFSNSYGTSGPRQTNTGFYGTYLFGRTHVDGEDLTASLDLNEHVELLLEDGFGAKLDLLPVLGGNLPKQMFIPGDPKQSLGSNFLHHAHVGLRVDDWLMLGAHYMSSWTPDDRNPTPHGEGRLSSTGVDVHVDHPRWGSGYIGFSHIWGHNLLPLDEALQVIHGGRGYDFKLQYFGNKFRQYEGSGVYLPNDGGRVETILFQHTFRSYELFGYAPREGVNLSLYAMYSHSYSPPTGGMTTIDLSTSGGPVLKGPFTIDDNKIKYGTLVEFAALRHWSFNGRFDRVQPTTSDPEQTYTAFTAQAILRSDWRSSRQIVFGYTRFILRAHDYPDSPYTSLQHVADPNLFVISAIMTL